MGLSTGNAAFLPGVQLKAWVLLSAAGAVLKSFNVASASKQATGAYQINFTTAMSSATYLVRYTSSSSAVQGGLGLLAGTANVGTFVSGTLTDSGGLWEFYE